MLSALCAGGASTSFHVYVIEASCPSLSYSSYSAGCGDVPCVFDSLQRGAAFPHKMPLASIMLPIFSQESFLFSTSNVFKEPKSSVQYLFPSCIWQPWVRTSACRLWRFLLCLEGLSASIWTLLGGRPRCKNNLSLASSSGVPTSVLRFLSADLRP